MKHRDTKFINDLPMLDDDIVFSKKIDWQKWEKEHLKNLHILKPKVVEKKKIPTVCLDTNVVIALMMLWSADSGQSCQIPPRSLSYRGIRTLQKLIEEKKIKAIITPYVLDELYVGVKKFGDGFIKYMKQNNVYALDIPKEKDIYFFEDVENTALRYCGRCKSPYAKNPKEGRRIENKIFPITYYYRIKRPDIDARIMAEASLLGCALVTQNFEHFIADQKDEKINRINKEMMLKTGIKPYEPCVFELKMEYNHQFPELEGKYKKYVKPAKEVEL